MDPAARTTLFEQAGFPSRTDPSRRPLRGGHVPGRGSALIEFALVLPLLIILVLATIDFGHLIQARLIITNVAREGGSIASRQTAIDSSLTGMLAASGRALALAGPDGRIFITRITAGARADAPSPTIAAQIATGTLGVGPKIAAGRPDLGLTHAMYNHLVFNSTNATADISEVTAVEVYYKYRSITPLPYFVPGLLRSDGDGVIIASKAVF